MTIGQIIDAVRARYLRRFETAVAEQSALAEHVLTEVALRDGSGAPVGEGLLGLPVRLDIVPMRGGQPGTTVSVDSESRVDFETVEFLWGDRLRVRLARFWWDSARVSVNVKDWEPVRRWFMHWFSADRDGDGRPIGVVHFLSDPKPGPSGESIEIDLGTAPVQAFEELLDAIAASGAPAVTIGDPGSHNAR